MQEDEIQATRDRWLRLDSWTPPQAFMLICKADPDSEGYPLKPLPCFESEFDPSEAFATYEELERIWYSGSHGNGNQNPSYFIDWATQKGLDVSWLENTVQLARDTAERPTETPEPPLSEIRGDTMDRLRRAVSAFPSAYPGYKGRKLKLDADVRVWLAESKLAENDREKQVFGQILKEHFGF